MAAIEKSYLAHDNQHAKAVQSHAAILADLEKDDLEEDELDAKVLEAEKVSKRATELKKIRDYKMSQIYQLLEKRYPDIGNISDEMYVPK